MVNSLAVRVQCVVRGETYLFLGGYLKFCAAAEAEHRPGQDSFVLFCFRFLFFRGTIVTTHG